MKSIVKHAVGIGFTLFMIVLLAGCSAGANTDSSTILTYGLTLVPSGIDPHINSSAELGIVLRSVYDTLVYRDTQTREFVPGLATSWQVSDDGLVYTFVLRQDVTFHDGTPFNAEAVKVNFERALNPANASQKAAQLLGPIKTIQVHDPYTISLTLSEPFAPLLDGLSQPYLGIASPTALSTYDTSIYQFHQVGTGPFRFVEYIVNDRIVLERNKAYNWGPNVTTNIAGSGIDKIVFRFYTDPPTRSLALESGDAQIMGELLPSEASRLAAQNKISLQPVPIPGQPLQLMLNTTRFPTDNASVRKALILAADRQAIAQTVFEGYSPIAYGPLSAVTLYYDKSMNGLYAYDPVQASALLDQAGLVDKDGDGWRDGADGELTLNVVIPPWGLMPEVAQLLQSQWQATLRLKVIIKQVASFPMLSDEAAASNYNAIGLNFSGLDPAFISAFYRSDGVRNWMHYSDPELDKWLSEAQTQATDVTRADLYARIQQRIMDKALIVPIRDYVNLNATRPGIDGLHFDGQGWFPYLVDIGFGQ